MAKFQFVHPILSVKNVNASIEHYTRVLGFSVAFTWPHDEPVKTFAGVCRGHVEIFLCQGAQGQPGTWMSIFVDDVDALFEEYKATNATIRQPPTTMPWGVREMNIEDPDGHRLRMSQASERQADGVLEED